MEPTQAGKKAESGSKLVDLEKAMLSPINWGEDIAKFFSRFSPSASLGITYTAEVVKSEDPDKCDLEVHVYPDRRVEKLETFTIGKYAGYRIEVDMVKGTFTVTEEPPADFRTEPKKRAVFHLTPKGTAIEKPAIENPTTEKPAILPPVPR